MSLLEKISYTVKSAVAKFKCWQVAPWVKITVAIAILVLFSGLVYVAYMLAQFIAFVAILALVISSGNLRDIPLSKDDDESDGYRWGHSGFGYYINNYYIESEDEDN